MVVDHIRTMDGRVFAVGDEVQDKRARFFIGKINDSCGLCFIDKEKPFTRLIEDGQPFSRSIDHGNYGVTYELLQHVEENNA